MNPLEKLINKIIGRIEIILQCHLTLFMFPAYCMSETLSIFALLKK